MKKHYRIETPHGVITRTSQRDYTHVVYSVRHPIDWEAPPRHVPGGTRGKVRWRVHVHVRDTSQPAVLGRDVAFCGSYALALKEKARRDAEDARHQEPTSQNVIVAATRS